MEKNAFITKFETSVQATRSEQPIQIPSPVLPERTFRRCCHTFIAGSTYQQRETDFAGTGKTIQWKARTEIAASKRI